MSDDVSLDQAAQIIADARVPCLKLAIFRIAKMIWRQSSQSDRELVSFGNSKYVHKIHPSAPSAVLHGPAKAFVK